MPVVSLWKSGNHLEHYRCLKRSSNQNQHTRFGGSWGVLGPGFITGASDDDPSGIGTYAVAGASTGSSTLWLALATFPMMAAIQFICAKIAMVTGGGLAGVLKEHYSRWLLYPAVLLLCCPRPRVNDKAN